MGTKEIVSRIHNNQGRFLKQKKDGMWEEISTVAARDKVSHALRTKVAGWKRNQEQHPIATQTILEQSRPHSHSFRWRRGERGTGPLGPYEIPERNLRNDELSHERQQQRLQQLSTAYPQTFLPHISRQQPLSHGAITVPRGC